MLAGKKVPGHLGVTAAHELAMKRQICRPLLLMIGQILERDVCVIDEEAIGRVPGFICERETAVGDVELTHFDIDRRAVVLLLDLLASRSYSLRFCLLSRWSMNVADTDPLDGRILDLDSGYLWRVFDQTVARHPPAAHRDIDLADLGIERAQRHVLDRELDARPRERLFKIVGMAVDRG